MKVLMKPIKMIAWFEETGKLTPVRYQMTNEAKENTTVNIDKIILREEEKLAGNRMYIYRCQSNIEGIEKVYELKYEVSTCKWFLYKI
ncbi:MAG: hypothetical protein N3B21_05950 [Clostridia bacterium]|nr:hypothetical protein [Clostridia bacterium]